MKLPTSIVILCSVFFLNPSVIFAQRAETLENNRQLAQLLRSRPRADLNRDGILSREELRAYDEEFRTLLVVFIHGGGFRGGDKGKARNNPVKLYFDAHDFLIK